MNRRGGAGAACAIALGLLMTGCAVGGSPEPTPEQAALSISPVSDEVYRCLVDKGWSPEIDWQGGINVTSETMTKEQLPLYDADSTECWSAIEERVAAMSDADIRAAYDAELATRECLIERGVEVAAAPSAQAYLDSFHGERWTAYAAAELTDTITDDPAWRELNEQCPQPTGGFGAR